MLTQEQRIALTMPYSDHRGRVGLKRLGLDQFERQRPKINGKEVTVVGTVKGLKSLAAPWVFCSLHTARQLLGLPAAARPRDVLAGAVRLAGAGQGSRGRAARGVRHGHGRLHRRGVLDAAAAKYWLLRTKAGIAIGYAALLGLFVGAVITAQTLYSATTANAKEFAILLALGIPRWRISMMVLAQSFWVGIIGIVLSYPVCLGLRYAALPAWQRRGSALGGAGRHRGP